MDIIGIDITPRWSDLARISIYELKMSDLPTRKFTIALLEDACAKLDALNDQLERDNELPNARPMTEEERERFGL